MSGAVKIGGSSAATSGGSDFRTDTVGNLGATHTSTLGTEFFLTTVGTLNANHIETIAGRAGGKYVLLRLQQDATGSRTLQISDGTTPVSVTINSAANAVTDILVICKDATDMDIVVLGGAGGEPTLAVTGSTGNLGTAQTVDFQNVAREKWLAGTLNGNLAVTVNNPVAGSRLRVLAVQDGTGGRTLTIAGQAVTIPTTATTGVAMVLAVWLDATTFRIESAGVYTESDPLAVLKSLGTTKGDLAVWTASGTVARQAVGTDGMSLVADSSQTNGVKYAAAPDEPVNTVATSGATQTIPAPATAAISRITLSANCTLTFPTAAAGRSFTVILVQDGTGSRTVTWPTVKWPGGTTPTLTTTAAKIDVFTFLCADGTNWLGFVSGQNL